MKVTEMGMIKWMYTVTRLDRNKNEYIRGYLGVMNMAGKMRMNKLGWFGHVKRRNYDKIIKKIVKIRK